MFIDSHCHLQFKSYDEDRDAVIARCREKGVIMNTIGTHIDTSKAAVALAEQYHDIYATVGLHPIQSKKVAVTEEYTSFVARGEDFDTAAYRALIASSKKVIAVGETGLDAYHVPKDETLADMFNQQWELFLKHYELAREFDLPLVLHVRDPEKEPDGSLVTSAHAEMITRLQSVILSETEQRGVQSKDPSELRSTFLTQRDSSTPSAKAESAQNDKVRGVVHCFTGNWNEAQEYLALGCYLGFTGVITFPPKKTDPVPQEALLEVVDNIPLDRILVETDAPFLAPQTYRGERCEPWMTEEVIRFIADRRGLLYEEMREITVENSRRLFTRI